MNLRADSGPLTLMRTQVEIAGRAWHVITCEYPPQIGGVSDCAAAISAGLAMTGQSVHVWCPPAAGPGNALAGTDDVHRELGSFARADWQRLEGLLDRFPAPRRLLVHWVPHGYGYRSMNLGFARWLARRSRRGDRLELVVHEPFLAWSAHPLKLAAGIVHRIMLMLAASGAERIWISIPAWERAVRPYVPRRLAIEWLPIPTPVAVVDDPIGVSRVRQRLAPDGERLIAHFGTHSPLVTNLLDAVLERVLDSGNARVVLIGRNSEHYAQSFVTRTARFNGRLAATGVLQPSDLSKHLQACDVLLQPYPDGVSTRRTTTIAGLAHGRAIVTNEGALSESLWRESGALALCTSPDPVFLADEVAALLADDRRRSALAARARQLYDRLFDIRHAVNALTGIGELSAFACSENLAS